jgi:hypothetical protein
MPAPTRPNYFLSQFLVVRDFKEEQDYHREMLQLHNQLMHDWGVVGDGLKVSSLSGTLPAFGGSGVNLSIGAGSAINSFGQAIVLEADTSIKITAGQDVWITIAFQELNSTDKDDKYPPPGGSENVTRLVPSPLVAAVTTAPPTDGTVITLAKVSANGTIDSSVRKLASSFMRVGGANDLSTGIGRQVGIGTVDPRAPLHIKGDAALLNLEGDTHGFVQFYPKGFDAGRKGWLGFGSAGDSHLRIQNEADGGNIVLSPIKGYVGISGSAGGAQGIQFGNREIKFRGDGIQHFSIFANKVTNALTFAKSGSTENMDTADANIMTLADSGNVGIGTTTPEGQLQIGDGWNRIGIGPTPDNRSDPTLYNTDYGTAYLGFNAVRTAKGWRRSGDGGNNGGSLIYNRIQGELCFVTLEKNDKDFLSDGEIKDRKRMVIDATGKVSIAKDLAVAGALAVRGAVTLRVDANNNPDTGHGIGYFGAGDKTVGEFAFDGPVFYGYGGGALGTSSGKNITLRWSGGNVGIGTTNPRDKLSISGGALSFESTIPGNPVPYVGLDYDAASDKLRFRTNIGTDKLNITAMVLDRKAGNVGIGATSPGANINTGNFFKADPAGKTLELYSAGNESVLTLSTSQDRDGAHLGGLYFTRAAGQSDAHREVAGIQCRQVKPDVLAGGSLHFFTKPAGDGVGVDSPRMVILDTGNIGIGTANPQARLTVRQESAKMSSTDLRRFMNSGRPALVLDLNFRDGDAGTFLDFSELKRNAGINQPVTVEAEGTAGYSFEKCANFTGGYCRVQDSRTDYRTGFTIEAWVRFRSFSDWARIIDFGNGPSADNILFTTVGGRPYLSVFQGGNAQSIQPKPGTGGLQLNTWTHLAATIDAGGNAVIYINGQIMNEGPVWLPQPAARGNSYIGKSNWAPDPAFDGWMASLRMYNRALSSTEINADMDADSKGASASVTDDMLNQAASGKAVFVCTNTGDGRNFDGGVEVRHTSLLQGIGLGYNTIYATGSQPNQSLTIRPRGRGNLVLNPLAGNVGIGTTQPIQARLVVRNAPSSTVAPYGFLNAITTGGNYSGPDSQNIAYSIYADARVAATEFNAFSDERIKDIQGRSDSALDLRTLLSIEVTDFRYKDVIGKGDALHKKVIAQQVKKVFPLAVSKHTDVVPDIYRPASLTNGWIELTTDLKKGDRVKLITEEGEEAVYAVLEATPDKFRVDLNAEGDQVFVFGREVNDFLNVDYDAISMLNVSATQQLKKEVETLRTEVAELKLANNALMKLQALDRVEASAPSLVVAKNGSNGNGRH